MSAMNSCARPTEGIRLASAISGSRAPGFIFRGIKDLVLFPASSLALSSVPILGSLIPSFLAAGKGDDSDNDERNEPGRRVGQRRIATFVGRLLRRWSHGPLSSGRSLCPCRAQTQPGDHDEAE